MQAQMSAQTACMLGIAAYWFATPPFAENDHSAENSVSVSRKVGAPALPARSRGGVAGQTAWIASAATALIARVLRDPPTERTPVAQRPGAKRPTPTDSGALIRRPGHFEPLRHDGRGRCRR